ncbi:MAG: hypothetical protein JWO86_552 [Myxococcaceae bacterium]|nr:hypothetical protein [Myxococcaceae bacterium]MEA2749295.1 hypothetical protein [Myxococcales bacterium]
MLIPVLVSRRHTVLVEGFFWQVVECEHCELEWAFQVRCGGIGQGRSPFLLDEKGARERAKDRAHRALKQDRQLALEGVTRNVACPGCNRYQSEMVESLRRTHGSSWAAAGVVCMLVASVLGLRGLTENEPLARSGFAWTVPAAIFVLVGAGLLARRSQLRRRFDPNAAAVDTSAASHSSPYRQAELPTEPPEESVASMRTEQMDAPAVITRAQYDAARAATPVDALPEIPWRKGHEARV